MTSAKMVTGSKMAIQPKITKNPGNGKKTSTGGAPSATTRGMLGAIKNSKVLGAKPSNIKPALLQKTGMKVTKKTMGNRTAKTPSYEKVSKSIKKSMGY